MAWKETMRFPHRNDTTLLDAFVLGILISWYFLRLHKHSSLQSKAPDDQTPPKDVSSSRKISTRPMVSVLAGEEFNPSGGVVEAMRAIGDSTVLSSVNPCTELG